MDQVLFLKLFAALFAIMNPIANLPVFLSLTADKGPGFERKVALTVLVGLALGWFNPLSPDLLAPGRPHVPS